MSDKYILRSGAIDAIKQNAGTLYTREAEFLLQKVIFLLKNAPAADVAEVVHGQWCVSKIRSIETVFYCSECKRTVTVGNDFFGEAPKSVSAAYPYCHCGAKMDGGNDDAVD